MLKFFEEHREHLPRITLVLLALTVLLLLRRTKKITAVITDSFNGNSASATNQKGKC